MVGFFDAGFPNFIYQLAPLELKAKQPLSEKLKSFGFYGPTCDSLDVMKVLSLPENISEGDYIEIGHLALIPEVFALHLTALMNHLQIDR